MISKEIAKNIGVRHSKFAIIGGGVGGLTLATKMSQSKDFENSEITIYEFNPHTYHKPYWAMVGTGVLPFEKARTPMEEVIPEGVQWVKDTVTSINPDENSFELKSGEVHTYENLILSSGVVFNWHLTKGLKQAIRDRKRPVSSIYYYPTLPKMEVLRQGDYKKALFTHPPGPITCEGAPQKVCYKTTDYWRKEGKNPEVHFYHGGDDIFSVPFYAEKLNQVADAYGVNKHFGQHLVEVKSDENVAVFKNLATGELEEVEFDFLHAVPEMSGRPFLEGSGLANKANLVEVDKGTLRHPKYQNVWGLGDGCNLPTSKCFSALYEQAEVLHQNLADVVVNGEEPSRLYDGYSGCPIMIGGDKVLLTETLFDGEVRLSFGSKQREERGFDQLVDESLFPRGAFELPREGMWQDRMDSKALESNDNL